MHKVPKTRSFPKNHRLLKNGNFDEKHPFGGGEKNKNMPSEDPVESHAHSRFLEILGNSGSLGWRMGFMLSQILMLLG